MRSAGNGPVDVSHPENRGSKFIAEISSNHNQDLGRSLELVEAAAECGFDAVKFQLFEIDKLFAPEILAASSIHRDRKKWELPREFIPHIAEKTKSLGMEFSCTPFDLQALDFVSEFVDFTKIASYELLWSDLIRAAGNTGKPVILSTGMANMEEVEAATSVLRSSGCADITVLHCVSEYPAQVKNCNLAAIATLRDLLGEKVGWSDHSSNKAVVLAAALRWQSDAIEVHFDLDGHGEEFGPGHCWLPGSISEVISTVRDSFRAQGSGAKVPSESENSERDWRADPSDGLRPVLRSRNGFAGARKGQ